MSTLGAAPARARPAAPGRAARSALLFVLNLVDEIDQVAFGIVAPEVRDTFGVSETSDHDHRGRSPRRS